MIKKILLLVCLTLPYFLIDNAFISACLYTLVSVMTNYVNPEILIYFVLFVTTAYANLKQYKEKIDRDLLDIKVSLAYLSKEKFKSKVNVNVDVDKEKVMKCTPEEKSDKKIEVEPIETLLNTKEKDDEQIELEPIETLLSTKEEDVKVVKIEPVEQIPKIKIMGLKLVVA